MKALALLFMAASHASAGIVANSSASPPATSPSGAITVTLRITNNDAVTATGVTPNMAAQPPSGASLSSGPVPPSANIPPSSFADFTYVYAAGACGNVAFQGDASGFEAAITVTAAPHTSSLVSVNCTPTMTPTPFTPSPSPTSTATPWIVYVTRAVPEVGDATIPGNIFHPLSGAKLPLRYDLPFEGRLSISIHNRLGQLIKRIEKDAPSGAGSDSWDGRTENGSMVGAGIYVAQFRAKGLNKLVKFVVIK